MAGGTAFLSGTRFSAHASKTSLTKAVRDLDLATVRSALDESPDLIGHRDERGRNWLHLACSIDASPLGLDPGTAVPIAELLLARGIGLNEPAFVDGSWQATPLWFAVARGRNHPLASYLLDRGSSPEHSLWAAVFADDHDFIRLLIAHGATIDAWAEGETALIVAVRSRKFDAAQLLLDAGADPNVIDESTGRTPLHMLLVRQTDLAFVQLLVDHGARGDIADRDGTTAAELLSRKRDPSLRAIGEALARK